MRPTLGDFAPGSSSCRCPEVSASSEQLSAVSDQLAIAPDLLFLPGFSAVDLGIATWLFRRTL